MSLYSVDQYTFKMDIIAEIERKAKAKQEERKREEERLAAEKAAESSKAHEMIAASRKLVEESKKTMQNAIDTLNMGKESAHGIDSVETKFQAFKDSYDAALR